MRDIVGVVEDVKQSGLGVAAAAEAYAPLAQSPFSKMVVAENTAMDRSAQPGSGGAPPGSRA